MNAACLPRAVLAAKMKRAAELDDDTDQPPRQQQRTEAEFVRIGRKEVSPSFGRITLRPFAVLVVATCVASSIGCYSQQWEK